MDIITIEIDGQKRTYKAPQSWNELSTQQALHCYKILTSNTPTTFRNKEIGVKKVALLGPLFGLDRDILIAYQRACIDQDRDHGQANFAAALNTLLKYTEFFFRPVDAAPASVAAQDIAPNPPAQSPPPPPQSYTISPSLTTPPYPQLINTTTQKKEKYFAPKASLANVTIYELGLIFSLYEQYAKTENDEVLNKLIASIYRPPKPDTRENKEKAYQGDIRLPLSDYEATIPRRTAEVAKLPTMVRKLIFFWIQSCIVSITEEWETLFRKESVSRRSKYGFGGLLLKLSNGVIHLDKVRDQPFQNVFVYLDMLEEQRLEAELKAATARRSKPTQRRRR